MANEQHGLDEATQMVRKWSTEAGRLARRTRSKRLLQRVVRAALWMLFTTFVVIPGMIAGGFLFGPRGVEGLIAAPAVLFTMWAAILYWYFGRKVRPRAILKADIARLPAQTGEWLEDARGKLPYVAQERLDSLAGRLEALTPQLSTLDAQTPDAHEIRRLLGEELPELVRGYTKVPLAFRQQPLHGGKTPERQLLEGLETIEQQIDHLHERLAVGDLHALATHERYLDLKYNRKGKID
jgi:hypothetical protein